jgi:predicted NAD/FAD-dependent oxidoreductase
MSSIASSSTHPLSTQQQTPIRVGVVGAGISGLVCAKRLLELSSELANTDTNAPGLQVTTLEWGRGPGGRTARRRVKIEVDNTDNGWDGSSRRQEQQQQGTSTTTTATTVFFDHAAPYFSAQTKEFRDGLLAQWEDSGFVSKWIIDTKSPRKASSLLKSESVEERERDEVCADDDDNYLWVGIPSQNSIAKGIVSDIQAHKSHHAGSSSRGESGSSSSSKCLFGQHVQSAEYDEQQKVWNVRVVDRNDKGGKPQIHTLDALVMSDKLLVLPNTYAILDPAHWKNLALPLNLESTGAVVLLVAFQKPSATNNTVRATATTVSGVRHIAPDEHPFLKTIIHDSSKPGRNKNEGVHIVEGKQQQQPLTLDSQFDLWVVHSTHEYAASHLVGEQLDDEEAVKKEMLDAFLATIVAEEEPAVTAVVDVATTDTATTDTAASTSTSLGKVVHCSLMAWDHAQPKDSKRLTLPHLLDKSRRAGVCGDFFFRKKKSTTTTTTNDDDCGDDGDDGGDGEGGKEEGSSSKSSSSGINGSSSSSLLMGPEGVEAAALSGLSLAEDLAPLLFNQR